MEVILRDDIDTLGRAGEMVKVKPGYARNYLLPRGLAYLATPGNKKRIEQERKHRAQQLALAKEEAEQLATTLASLRLAFTAKTGDGDRLFGSITAADIADRLAEQGHAVDKRIIEIPEPIKMIGEHKVPVRLHPDVRPELTVVVEKE